MEFRVWGQVTCEKKGFSRPEWSRAEAIYLAWQGRMSCPVIVVRLSMAVVCGRHSRYGLLHAVMWHGMVPQCRS